MRIAFVHGINNEHNDADSIRETWWGALEQAWEAAGLPPKPRPQIDVGYYGKLLDNDASNDVVEMGPGVNATGQAAALLQEYAEAAGLTQAELEAAAVELGIEPQVVEQGFPLQGTIVKFASVLELALPTKGKYLARLFLKQAIKYIGDKALAAQIDRTVRKAILDDREDPVTVVAHSLGTVVSYRVLADVSAHNRHIPLFVTLGSPLSVRMFRSILPARGSIPTPPIGRWINARNSEDFVTLARPINRTSIGFEGVEDHPGVKTSALDVHDVTQYLKDSLVSRAIYDQL
jgi:hypothetical protein